MKVARPTAVFGALVLTCALSAAINAQTRVNHSGNGGINTIKGQIFVPGNKRADGSVTVRLKSTTFTDLSLITDQSGGFEFRSLSAGTYTVIVDAGETFEVIYESVTIDPDVQPDRRTRMTVRPTPKTYQVPIYLRLKRNADERTGVVNAKLVQVPKEALKHYEKGLELVQTGKVDEAMAEFKAAVAMYPFALAYLEMGKIYLRRSKLADALAMFELAVRHDTNDFDSRLNYAVALYNSKRLDDAEKEFNEAARLNASAVWPHYYLGLISIQRKNYETAQAEMETAERLKGEKNFPLLHRYLGGVYIIRNLNKQAVTQLETYLQLDPKAKDADRIRQTIADLKAKSN
jgi:tetratricopeptide (TPR) repeat protein